jgi:hypothetical protein
MANKERLPPFWGIKDSTLVSGISGLGGGRDSMTRREIICLIRQRDKLLCKNIMEGPSGTLQGILT